MNQMISCNAESNQRWLSLPIVHPNETFSRGEPFSITLPLHRKRKRHCVSGRTRKGSRYLPSYPDDDDDCGVKSGNRKMKNSNTRIVKSLSFLSEYVTMLLCKTLLHSASRIEINVMGWFDLRRMCVAGIGNVFLKFVDDERERGKSSFEPSKHEIKSGNVKTLRRLELEIFRCDSLRCEFNKY